MQSSSTPLCPSTLHERPLKCCTASSNCSTTCASTSHIYTSHTHANPTCFTQVALKALSLKALRDWKQLELFQREAKVLQGLSHPGIPRYLEYFEEDTESDRAFYIVQVRREGGGCLCAWEAGYAAAQGGWGRKRRHSPSLWFNGWRG
jgi:hypothetical protein